MNIRKSLIALLAAGAVAITAVAPASAVTRAATPIVPESSTPAPVQVRDHHNHGTVIIRKGNRYWNGHRGYNYRRNGYLRYHDGYWYPRSAFGLNIIIAPQPRRIIRSISAAHIDWCFANYRSYRASDNSWKPHNRPRRICVSPYY